MRLLIFFLSFLIACTVAGQGQFLVTSIGLDDTEFSIEPLAGDSTRLTAIHFHDNPGDTTILHRSHDSIALADLVRDVIVRGGYFGGVQVEGYTQVTAAYQRLHEALRAERRLRALERLWEQHTGEKWTSAVTEFDDLIEGSWELVLRGEVIDTIRVVRRSNRVAVLTTLYGNGTLEIFGEGRVLLRGLLGIPSTMLVRYNRELEFGNFDTDIQLVKVLE
jgi:hypothetical protein